ncbi:MAG: DMT family transporter [Peptococcaceae bacterium]|nr:DMT family transporter [Peptococcaceae bacterium]
MNRYTRHGHMTAILTVLIWGTTFISTKVLLEDFQPVEILFIRFLLGYAALWLVYPHPLRGTTARQEAIFAGAGLCGICLYYLLENIALSYSMASNVGVIVAVAPLFTALLAQVFLRGEERLSANFFAGFLVAMVGVALISFNGQRFALNPLGDGLALLAALIWGFYSIFTRKIAGFGVTTLQATRRTFFYGLLFMLPALVVFDVRLDIARLADPVNALNLLFLGLGASALCFVTWNMAIKRLGVVQASLYIFLTPVITVVCSLLILHEPFTWMTALGTLLTLRGLVLSERRSLRQR